jgi:hypothetical protein
VVATETAVTAKPTTSSRVVANLSFMNLSLSACAGGLGSLSLGHGTGATSREVRRCAPSATRKVWGGRRRRNLLEDARIGKSPRIYGCCADALTCAIRPSTTVLRAKIRRSELLHSSPIRRCACSITDLVTVSYRRAAMVAATGRCPRSVG